MMVVTSGANPSAEMQLRAVEALRGGLSSTAPAVSPPSPASGLSERGMLPEWAAPEEGRGDECSRPDAWWAGRQAVDVEAGAGQADARNDGREAGGPRR